MRALSARSFACGARDTAVGIVVSGLESDGADRFFFCGDGGKIRVVKAP